MSGPLKPATIAAHAGGAVDPASGGVVPSIQPATTYLRGPDYQPLRPDNIYLRDQSDTVRMAEGLLAKLEGAAETLLFPSGMAAIAAVFRTVLAGQTVVVQSGIYWGTTAWVRDFCARRDVILHEVDASDLATLEAICTQASPGLVFVETPSNPWLKTVDVARAAKIAHGAGAKLVVDATAATPILMQPLALGADVVMHSATKAINGHSDVLAGVLSVAEGSDMWDAIKVDRHDAGAVIGPFEAWLLIRGIRTLPLRMERMSENAQALAEHLMAHESVEDVFYPGLPHHEGHDVASAQMSGFGSLMSVLVKGGAAEALAVVGKLEVFLRATSLGGVESLVEHRHTIEPHTGIPENLIRVSVGIEDIGDLVADWDQALA